MDLDMYNNGEVEHVVSDTKKYGVVSGSVFFSVETWQDTEESEEKYVLDDSTGLSWGLKSMGLKYSYEFIMMNLSWYRWREHWNFSIKQFQEDHV